MFFFFFVEFFILYYRPCYFTLTRTLRMNCKLNTVPFLESKSGCFSSRTTGQSPRLCQWEVIVKRPLLYIPTHKGFFSPTTLYNLGQLERMLLSYCQPFITKKEKKRFGCMRLTKASFQAIKFINLSSKKLLHECPFIFTKPGRSTKAITLLCQSITNK
jgi:hypothetical protein